MTMLSITPDQMASAGGYISREWGDYGYRIEEIESPTRRVSLFHVVASDGARFIVAADRWGNCRTVDEHAGWRGLVDEMHAKAAPEPLPDPVHHGDVFSRIDAANRP